MYSNWENCCGEVNKVCELFFLSAKVLVITGHQLCIPYHTVCLPYSMFTYSHSIFVLSQFVYLEVFLSSKVSKFILHLLHQQKTVQDQETHQYQTEVHPSDRPNSQSCHHLKISCAMKIRRMKLFVCNAHGFYKWMDGQLVWLMNKEIHRNRYKEVVEDAKKAVHTGQHLGFKQYFTPLKWEMS